MLERQGTLLTWFCANDGLAAEKQKLPMRRTTSNHVFDGMPVSKLCFPCRVDRQAVHYRQNENAIKSFIYPGTLGATIAPLYQHACQPYNNELDQGS